MTVRRVVVKDTVAAKRRLQNPTYKLLKSQINNLFQKVET